MDTDRFIDLLLTGQYLPAIGLMLVAFVAAARAGLVKLSPWFATKPGGYLVGFSSAAILFLAAALEAGRMPTLGIIAGALGAGWAASGGFEMIRDLFAYLRRKKLETGIETDDTQKKVRPVALVLLVAMLLGACGSRPYLPPVTHPIIDCAQAQRRPIIDAAVAELWPAGGQAPDIERIKQAAIARGVELGGCIFSAFVQRYLAPAPGTAVPPPECAIAVKDAFEQYRNSHANNATFRHPGGDL